MILCWGLSAVAFILDRFRLPLLLPFLCFAIFSAHIHFTDHYFHMTATQMSPDISPAQVIRAGKPGSTVIVVAASGGGIKAAAWTARVLTGLEESARADFPATPRIFGDSVGPAARLSKPPSPANCPTANIASSVRSLNGAMASSRAGAPPWSSTPPS